MAKEITVEEYSAVQKQIAGYVERARIAQAELATYDQRRVDELAAAIVYTLSRPAFAQKVGELVMEETQMGALQSKIGKLTGLPRYLHYYKSWPTVGVIERIPEKGLVKMVKPIGVVGCVCPSTNPEGTPAFNALMCIRARNACIVGAHKKSYKSTKMVVDAVRAVMKANGAPEDFMICVENPTIDTSKEVMRQCDLTFATGAQPMVRSAYSSGKPAIGVGAGNCISVIDKEVDMDRASTNVVLGKSAGDRAAGCSTEQSVAVQASIYDEFLKLLQLKGGYLCNEQEKEQLVNTVWPGGTISHDIIAKPVEYIAEKCGITIPEGTRFLMVEDSTDHVGPEYPLCKEKLSLILTVYKYDAFEDAIDLVNRCHNVVGKGHSCNIQSTNDDNILKFALETFTCRVSANMPNGLSNGGAPWNGLNPTFSIGCGTWGGNSVSENVHQYHYMNQSVLHFPVCEMKDAIIPTDADAFGDLLTNVQVYEDASLI